MRKREDGLNSQTVAKNKYNAKNYDRIAIQVNKGEREKVQAHAASKGESVNGLVNRLLADEMSNNRIVIVLSDQQREKVQAHAASKGQSVNEFINSLLHDAIPELASIDADTEEN